MVFKKKEALKKKPTEVSEPDVMDKEFEDGDIVKEDSQSPAIKEE